MVLRDRAISAVTSDAETRAVRTREGIAVRYRMGMCAISPQANERDGISRVHPRLGTSAASKRPGRDRVRRMARSPGATAILEHSSDPGDRFAVPGVMTRLPVESKHPASRITDRHGQVQARLRAIAIVAFGFRHMTWRRRSTPVRSGPIDCG